MKCPHCKQRIYIKGGVAIDFNINMKHECFTDRCLYMFRHVDGYWKIRVFDKEWDVLVWRQRSRVLYEHYVKMKLGLRIVLPKCIDIHHKNGRRDDDSFENLELVDHREHHDYHLMRLQEKYGEKLQELSLYHNSHI